MQLIEAIQVLRFHLLEIEKVRPCDLYQFRVVISYDYTQFLSFTQSDSHLDPKVLLVHKTLTCNKSTGTPVITSTKM